MVILYAARAHALAAVEMVALVIADNVCGALTPKPVRIHQLRSLPSYLSRSSCGFRGASRVGGAGVLCSHLGSVVPFSDTCVAVASAKGAIQLVRVS